VQFKVTWNEYAICKLLPESNNNYSCSRCHIMIWVYWSILTILYFFFTHFQTEKKRIKSIWFNGISLSLYIFLILKRNLRDFIELWFLTCSKDESEQKRKFILNLGNNQMLSLFRRNSCASSPFNPQFEKEPKTKWHGISP